MVQENTPVESRVPILQSNSYKEENEEETNEHEEQCYGWIVVFASFLCNMVIDGIGYSFGILLDPLREEFKAGAGSVAFVGSILAGVIMLVGPVAATADNRYLSIHNFSSNRPRF